MKIMRKANIIILFFVAILLQGNNLYAQSVVWTALVEDADQESTCGLIRSWKASKAVAYHKRNGNQLFSIIDSAAWTVYSAKVPTFYSIRDFRIVGDTLYCCGSSHDTAMLAYFNINEITGSPYINFRTFTIKGLSSVSHIAAFRNKIMNGVGVAAIGVETRFYEPYWFSRTHMVWCDNYNGTPFTISTKECDISWTLTQPSESLSDVTVTESYVVYVGIYTNSNDICIRKGDKNGPFSSPLINTIHHFSHLEPLESLPIVETLEHDTIAIASAGEDIPNELAAHIRLIDLSSMNLYNCHRIRLGVDSKVAVNELIYMPTSKLLLMEAETDAGHQVIYLKPSAINTYYAKTIAPATGEMICSMDPHNRYYYILSTNKHWMLQRMGALPTSDVCIRQDSREVLIWTVSLVGSYTDDGPSLPSFFTDRKLFPTSFNTTLFCVQF